MSIVMEEQIEKVQVKTNWTDNTQNVTVFFFVRQKTRDQKNEGQEPKMGDGDRKWETRDGDRIWDRNLHVGNNEWI